jgi:hypothetical protein
MYKKLLLAATITFALNLFLRAGLGTSTRTVTSFHLAKMPSFLVQMMLEAQALRQNLLPSSAVRFY